MTMHLVSGGIRRPRQQQRAGQQRQRQQPLPPSSFYDFLWPFACRLPSSASLLALDPCWWMNSKNMKNDAVKLTAYLENAWVDRHFSHRIPMSHCEWRRDPEHKRAFVEAVYVIEDHL